MNRESKPNIYKSVLSFEKKMISDLYIERKREKKEENEMKWDINQRYAI